jgi:hypothetical protein
MRRALWAAARSAVFLSLVAGTAGARDEEAGCVPAGSWGGSHLRLEVKADGALLEFDCAHGRIPGPLKLDGEGRFETKGTYAREHGGPVRAGEEEQEGEPARYSGRLEGKLLTLTVKAGPRDEVIGTYKLRQGQTPRIVKCL